MEKQWLNLEQLIHSFKTALACLIGAIVVKIAGLASGQWIMITIVVVMCAQINVGGLMIKSYLRFLGTFLGCLIAILVLVTLGSSEITRLFTIAGATFFFAYIATSKENLVYAGTLGAATTAIVMVAPNPSVSYAVDRFLEISLGLIIATVVSQFVLPIHASTHLRRAQANTLRALKKYYQICVSYPEDQQIDFQATDEGIVKSITKQRQLAKESLREPVGFFFDQKQFTMTLQNEKEILRAINFMHNALMNMQKHKHDFLALPSLPPFNQAVLECFDDLIKVIDRKAGVEHQFRLPTLEYLKQDLESRENGFKDESIYIDGFLFSAEALVNNLSSLASLFRLSVSELSSNPLKASV